MEMHLTALKEPRGFIRILQAFFAVLAFSITAGYSTTTKIMIDCKFEAPVEIKFGYPFRMRYFPFDVPKNCTDAGQTSESMTLPYNLSSNPEFFVACGVLSFMYCSAIVAVYVLRAGVYQSNQTIPILDLGATAVLTIFWFAGTCAWAQGVSDVKYYMDQNLIIKRINVCAQMIADSCVPAEPADYSSLNVSVLLGFLNVLLWSMGTWFVYKDTALHRQQLPPGAPGSQYPPVGATYPPQSPTQPMQGQFQQPQY